MHKIKKDDGRINTTWGLKKDSPAKKQNLLNFQTHKNDKKTY